MTVTDDEADDRARTPEGATVLSAELSKCREVCRRRLSGFTMIEMIVVITIIGLLVALLIPAVQASREAARRANCVANMKQLGIALNSYHSSVGVLPPPNNGKRGFSVHAMILPQLDLPILFNSTNFSVYSIDMVNETVYSARISTFLCPSDQSVIKSVGWTNYACNTGYGYQVYKKFNGSFAQPPELSSTASMTDGTSVTAMMAEWVQGSGMNLKNWDRLGSVSRISPLFGPDQFDQAISNCVNQANIIGVDFHYDKGKFWIRSGLGVTLYNHNMVVNGYSCLNGDRVREGSWTASSRHAGGANLLFADGHVQFLRQGVSLPVWRALGTRSGSEVISQGDY